MLETSSMQSQEKIRGIGSASWRGEGGQGVKGQDRASRLGKGHGKGHSPWEFTMEPQASPNPAGRRENEGTCNLTSKLLWPELWDMARREGVQHTAGETRARQQAELPARTSEFQTGKRLPSGPSRTGATLGASGGVLSALCLGARGRTRRAASRRGG